MWLFHYTNTESAKEIMSSGFIMPSIQAITATRSAETASTSLNSSAFLNLRQNARMSSPPYPAAAVLDAFALWPEGLAPGGARLAAADGAPTTGFQK